MKRLLQENRLLSAIVLWALIAGTWELTQIAPGDRDTDPTESLALLGKSYPNDARVMFSVGASQLRAGDPGAAVTSLGASYDAGYKENENLYAFYIDALVRTQSSRERIEEVVARWRRDYPTSDRLQSIRERLRKARVLP